MRVTDYRVARSRREWSSEAWYQSFLQSARTERLYLVSVEGAEPREQLSAIRQPMIEPKTELIQVAVLFLDWREVL